MILDKKTKELKEQYAKRFPADVNWQLTLNKDVKNLLTLDTYTSEEEYYGPKPGHYIRALIEEYCRLPFYVREKIVFKPVFDKINSAIDSRCLLSIETQNGARYIVKPCQIATDSLSMYHYLACYSTTDLKNNAFRTAGFRISRIAKMDIHYYDSSYLSETEKDLLDQEISHKGIQFLTSDSVPIKVWLSDKGIEYYNTRIHLRPVGYTSEKDTHIYYFECPEVQILYYFFSFGKEAKILVPSQLADKFKQLHLEAYETYL